MSGYHTSRGLLRVSWDHYSDAIMSSTASQITSLTIVYSTVYSGVDQRKHQSSASLAFVRGIHRWPVNSPRKGPVTRKNVSIDDVIMTLLYLLGGELCIGDSNKFITIDYIYIHFIVFWFGCITFACGVMWWINLYYSGLFYIHCRCRTWVPFRGHLTKIESTEANH